jgi:hypothetical protein
MQTFLLLRKRKSISQNSQQRDQIRNEIVLLILTYVFKRIRVWI